MGLHAGADEGDHHRLGQGRLSVGRNLLAWVGLHIMGVPCVRRFPSTVLELPGSLSRLTVCHECGRAKAGILVDDMMYRLTIEVHEVNEHRPVKNMSPGGKGTPQRLGA